MLLANAQIAIYPSILIEKIMETDFINFVLENDKPSLFQVINVL